MKGYVILLGALYLSTLAVSAMALRGPAVGLVPVKAVLDVVLFGLCLWGGISYAFGRRLRLDAGKWRLISRITLAAGAFFTLGMVWGRSLGIPTPHSSPGLITAAMTLLPYVLFAVPAILYANAMDKNPARAPHG